MFSLTVKFDQLERAAQGLHAAAGALVPTAVLVKSGSDILVRYIREAAPKKTGRGAASIQAKGNGIYAFAYMSYVDQGTKPHTIVPVKARVLAFEVSGQTVFATRVNHPGTKPRHFVKAGVDAAKPSLQVLMLENGRRILTTIGEGG